MSKEYIKMGEAMVAEIERLQAELRELRQYKEETIWRVTNDDLHDALVRHGIPQDKWSEVYDFAKRNFDIVDWTVNVSMFTSLHQDKWL